ncbi:UDP-glucuronic acid decarboxylase family protein [Candidatus Planktophila dulcis]|uniref:UDP-glucuronic acid decarboxylase family protein n=1 Tax=Candidatus Planktophila dulcis TaxID=1884914 RepID=UPI003CF7999B
MRILITGGAGFIGSHLTERLLREGHEVVAIDNFFTGSRDNVKKFLDNKNYEVIRHDVTMPFSAEVDMIFNLACPASPVHYQRFPVQTLKTSLLGSINMLELAREKNARIIQASTSEVYGDPIISPQVETYWGNVNPIGIRACYDEGKRASEALFFDYYRQYRVDIKVARIFNTYGPNMALNDGRVVSNFLVQALQDMPITMYGDGLQTRSFCFVSDLVDGLFKLAFSDQEIQGPINLGNPNEFTMLQLAELIIELTGSKSRIEFKHLPSDDPKQRKPDIFQAKASLAWEPTIELREGIQASVEYFKTALSK